MGQFPLLLYRIRSDGVAWQAPLLTLSAAVRFLAAVRTLGYTSFVEQERHRRLTPGAADCKAVTSTGLAARAFGLSYSEFAAGQYT